MACTVHGVPPHVESISTPMEAPLFTELVVVNLYPRDCFVPCVFCPELASTSARTTPTAQKLPFVLVQVSAWSLMACVLAAPAPSSPDCRFIREPSVSMNDPAPCTREEPGKMFSITEGGPETPAPARTSYITLPSWPNARRSLSDGL